MLRFAIVAALLLLANLRPAEASPITFAVNVTSAGSLTAAAADTINPGDDITVNSGIQVQSTGGSVTFQAGDNVNLNSTATIAAFTGIFITTDFGSVDHGAIANILGHLSAPNATISGGAFDDIFNIVPDASTPILVHGAAGFNGLTYQGATGILTLNPGDPRSGTITAPGFATVTFDNIDTISGSLASPEPGADILLLAGPAGLAGYRGGMRKIGVK